MGPCFRRDDVLGTVLAALSTMRNREYRMNMLLRPLLFTAAMFAAVSAHADDWPTHLIKATIPFGAGSAADVVPRLVCDRLAAELGQPIVIENRVGAGGTLGTAVVAKADPDGYSVLAHSSALTIAPAIFPNLAFDATKDLRSEEHTSELQSRPHLVCRLLLEKKKKHALFCAQPSKKRRERGAHCR